jgi:hypothetical protein
MMDIFLKSECGVAIGLLLWSLIPEIFCKLAKPNCKTFVGIKTGLFLVCYIKDILLMYD